MPTCVACYIEVRIGSLGRVKASPSPFRFAFVQLGAHGCRRVQSDHSGVPSGRRVHCGSRRFTRTHQSFPRFILSSVEGALGSAGSFGYELVYSVARMGFRVHWVQSSCLFGFAFGVRKGHRIY